MRVRIRWIRVLGVAGLLLGVVTSVQRAERQHDESELQTCTRRLRDVALASASYRADGRHLAPGGLDGSFAGYVERLRWLGYLDPQDPVCCPRVEVSGHPTCVEGYWGVVGGSDLPSQVVAWDQEPHPGPDGEPRYAAALADGTADVFSAAELKNRILALSYATTYALDKREWLARNALLLKAELEPGCQDQR